MEIQKCYPVHWSGRAVFRVVSGVSCPRWAIGAGALHLTGLNIYCWAMLLSHSLCLYHRKFLRLPCASFAMTFIVTTFHWDQMGTIFTTGGDRRTSLSTASLKPHSLVVQKILLVLGKLLELTKTEVGHAWPRDRLQLYWPEHIMKLLDKSSYVTCVIPPPPCPRNACCLGPFRPMLSILLLDLFFKILMSSRRDFFPCLNLCHLPFLIWR